jgi:hypothetical protein
MKSPWDMRMVCVGGANDGCSAFVYQGQEFISVVTPVSLAPMVLRDAKDRGLALTAFGVTTERYKVCVFAQNHSRSGRYEDAEKLFFLRHMASMSDELECLRHMLYKWNPTKENDDV